MTSQAGKSDARTGDAVSRAPAKTTVPQHCDPNATAERKDHHIDIVLQREVVAPRVTTGLGHYTLEFDALPEIALEEVDLSTRLLGRSLRAPLLIGAMTGGTERAARINRTLARAAARIGVGMALGSQRAMIENPALSRGFAVREDAPDLPLLIGNIGAVQLNYGVDPASVARAVHAVGADALNLHLNCLQEAVQPEGDTDFRGLGKAIAQVATTLDLPCLAKEVGSGFGPRAAAKLAELPLAGVEVAGVGGTSWARVESFRAAPSSQKAEVGQRLGGFGIPTGESIQVCRRIFADRVVIGSGGVRTGMDVAVAIALGADAVALAKPLLEAAEQGESAAEKVLATLLYELRVICFCTGCRTPSELRGVRVHRVG